MEKKNVNESNHSISIIKKEKIEMTGAVEVLSSTEKEIIVRLESELLYIFGSGLAIQKLVPEEKFLQASGKVEGIKYAPKLNRKTLLQKVFK